MNESQAELTTVISHLPDGRIHQFVKTPIRLAEAEQMRVKARLEAEEFRAKVVLQKTDAVLASVEKAAPVARPVPQQRAVPRAPAVMAPAASDPVDAVVPARDALVPARVMAERRKKLEAEQRVAVAKAKELLSEYTIRDGKQVGRALMLDLIDRTPPGHQARNVDRALDEIMGRALKQLQDHKDYPLARWPEFSAFFERGFWLGANEAVAEYNNKPKLPAPAPVPRQADASATQTSI
jgi:hypothetical protein